MGSAIETAANETPEGGREVRQRPSTVYTHKALIDTLLLNPGISNRELARKFGYSESWLSTIKNSDAFREKLAERKAEIVDPILETTIEDKLRGLAEQACEVLEEKLRVTGNSNVAVRVLDIATRGLIEAKAGKIPQFIQNFVAVVPAKSASSAEWVEQHRPLVLEHQDPNRPFLAEADRAAIATQVPDHARLKSIPNPSPEE